MTNEEAVKWLRAYPKMTDFTMPQIEEALDMAEKALMEQAQADGEYIPKQAVIEQVKDWMNTELRDKTNALHYLEKRLNELPSVDIQQDHDGCKDCKYETYPDYYYPCCSCKQNYTDEWQKKPHWNHGVCDNCGYDWGKDAPIASVPNFCPNCGSPMEIER